MKTRHYHGPKALLAAINRELAKRGEPEIRYLRTLQRMRQNGDSRIESPAVLVSDTFPGWTNQQIQRIAKRFYRRRYA